MDLPPISAGRPLSTAPDATTSPDPTPRSVALGIGALTLVALALRLYHYGDRLPWIDEVETRLYAASSFGAPLRRAFAGPPVTTPPLYFALLRLLAPLHLAGAHLRLPSVLAGAAAIPALFALGRRLHSPIAGLCAAALLTCSPLHVRYAQEARPYALLVLSTIVFLIGVLDLLGRDGPTGRACFVAGGAVCALSQYAGVLIVGIGVGWVLLQRRDRVTWIGSALLLLCCAATSAQLVVGMRGGATAMPHLGRLVFPIDRAQALGLVVALGSGRPDHPWPGLVLVSSLWLSGFVVLLRRAPRVAYLWLVVAIVPVLVMTLPPTTYAFSARYALPVAALGATLGGIALGEVTRRWPGLLGGVLVVGALAAWGALSLQLIAEQTRDLGTRYDRLGRFLDEHVRSGERVVVLLLDEPVAYYAPSFAAALRPFVRPEIGVVAVSAWPEGRAELDPDRDWLVSFNRRPIASESREEWTFPPDHGFAPVEGVVLGRAAAAATLFAYPPRRP